FSPISIGPFSPSTMDSSILLPLSDHSSIVAHDHSYCRNSEQWSGEDRDSDSVNVLHSPIKLSCEPYEEEESDEDEVTSESDYYYGDEDDCSDSDDSEDSESSDIEEERRCLTPVQDNDEKVRMWLFGEKMRSEEEEMRKTSDGHFIFTSNRTPWSFDLVI
ncbi:hypothetical protein PENTCL1PPCAC_8072, partial [Pristionchus entomophagus]